MALRNDAPLRIFHPRWPAPRTIDAARVAFGYDRLSDTLFVDWYGIALPAVSVLAPEASDDLDVYLRVDPVSEEVVGLQIEGVAATAQRPAWLDDALSLVEPGDVDHSPAPPVAVDTHRVVAALFDALGPRSA